MPLLQYDIAVVGEQKLRRSLRGIEQEFTNHARTVDRLGGGTRGGPYRSRAGASSGIRQQVSNATRAFDQIGRAARAAYLREGRDRIAADKRANQQILRERERMARRAAQAEVAAARNAARRRERFAHGVATHVGRGFGNVAGVVTRGAGILGGLATGVALHNELGYRKGLADLSNQAYREGGPKSRQQIMDEARAVTTKTGASGLGATETLAALRQFVSITGDFETGKKLLPSLTKTALATGANTSDVAGTAGNVMLQLQSNGVKGADALKQLNDVLATVAAQGKKGSIEFKDMAQIMAQVGASTSNLGGKVSDRIATMGALAQLSRRGGSPNAAESATAMMRMSDDMLKNAKRFKHLPGGGVDVFRYDKQHHAIGLRDPVSVLSEAYRKSGGDIRKTSSLFGIRGKKGADAFFNIARQMGHGNVDKGITAANLTFQEFFKARMSTGERDKSASFAENQPGMKSAAAMEKFNREVGERLIPVLTKLIPKFEELIPDIAKAATTVSNFIGWASDHPAEGIGALVGASIAKDLAKAGLAKGLQAALEKSLAGTAAIGALTLTAATVYMTVSKFNKEMEDVDTTSDLVKKGQDAIHSQNVTAAPKLIKRIKNHIKTLQSTSPGVLAKTEGWLTGSDPEQMKKTEIASLKNELIQIKKRFNLDDQGKELSGAAKQLSAAAKHLSAVGADPGSGGSPNRHDPIVKQP